MQHKVHVNTDFKWTGEDSFQLLNRLGAGAFGVVYRGIHKETQFELAIKTIILDKTERDVIQKEVEILKSLRDNNIVNYYGTCKKEDDLWIIMDYCGGGSLYDYLKLLPEKHLKEAEIGAVFVPVLQGLEYLHSKGIIHRDLKAANILLNEKGEPKIADFGVSAQVGGMVSKAKTLIGTPLFMSPELLEGEKYNIKADIWSLGITCIELAEGTPPYSEEHVMRAMLLIAKDPPPRLKEPSKWSEQFNAFIAYCLTKDPSKRPSARELSLHAFILSMSMRGKENQKVLQDLIGRYKQLRRMEQEASEERKEIGFEFDENNTNLSPRDSPRENQITKDIIARETVSRDSPLKEVIPLETVSREAVMREQLPGECLSLSSSNPISPRSIAHSGYTSSVPISSSASSISTLSPASPRQKENLLKETLSPKSETHLTSERKSSTARRGSKPEPVDGTKHDHGAGHSPSVGRREGEGFVSRIIGGDLFNKKTTKDIRNVFSSKKPPSEERPFGSSSLSSIIESIELDEDHIDLESSELSENPEELRQSITKLKEVLKRERQKNSHYETEKSVMHAIKSNDGNSDTTKYLIFELEETKQKLKNSEQLVALLTESISILKKESQQNSGLNASGGVMSSTVGGENIVQETSAMIQEAKAIMDSNVKNLLSEIERQKKNMVKLESDLTAFLKSNQSSNLYSLSKRNSKK